MAHKREPAEWTCVNRVVSGGQNGADRAALEAAEAMGLETGGWAARDFQTTTGSQSELGSRFGLQPVQGTGGLSASYVLRSKRNVEDADATVAFRWHGSVGTDKTIGYCRTHKWGNGVGFYTKPGFRPCLVISELCHARFADNASLLYLFLIEHKVRTLNVCGHREAPPGCPDYEFQIKRLLMLVLNPRPDLHPRLEGIPLARQYAFAAYSGAWLRDEDHCYINEAQPSKFYTPSSTLQKRMFPQFEHKEEFMARRCAGSSRSSGGKYEFCTPSEVLQMWEANREEASRLGTDMHNSFEDCYNGKPTDMSTVEFGYVRRFMADNPTLVPIAAELVMLEDYLQMGGTSDIFFRDIADPDPDAIVIGDWKRSRELRYRGFGGECGYRPATFDRQNCNHEHFTVNMTQYKFMIERPRYGKRVKEMFLVGCHPDHGTYELAPIKWDRNHANEIVAERLRDKLVYGYLGPPTEIESMPWNAIPARVMLTARSWRWSKKRPRVELPSAETVELHRKRGLDLLRVRVFRHVAGEWKE